MNPTTIGLIVLMVAIFYFLMIRPQQKKQKEQQSMQKSLGAGSTVMLASGVYGEIVDNSNDKTSTVRIAPGVEITVVKQAIVKSVPASEFPGASEPDGPADEIDRQGSIDQSGSDAYDADLGDEATDTASTAEQGNFDRGDSGYDAPGSATRSRGAEPVSEPGIEPVSDQGHTGSGSSPLRSTRDSSDTAAGESRVTDGDPTDDENPTNPKA